jgi:hypothetical protein
MLVSCAVLSSFFSFGISRARLSFDDHANLSAEFLSNIDSQNLTKSGTDDLDFYSVLIHVIEDAKNDPAQLRGLIYELARSKLRAEAFANDMRMSEVRAHLLALEAAIARVESISALQNGRRPIQLAKRTVVMSLGFDEQGPEGHQERNRPSLLLTDTSQTRPLPQPTRVSFFPLIQMLGVAVFAFLVSTVLYWGATRGLFNLRNGLPPTGEKRNVVAAHPAANPNLSESQTLPLPTSFGVYAVSLGHLRQLEPLRVRIPDPRVLIGPMITAPTQVRLPDGEVTFVVYRRDLMFDVPDKVSVRVLARVARAITFDGGKAVAKSEEPTWAIRSKSYELGVFPVEQNREMILVRPMSAGFVLPAGRYALVFKGIAYDFAIDGEASDPSQCIERVEAANGNFYSECKRP